MNIRTLFISDTHLGSSHAATKELIELLDKVKEGRLPEKIYLVGDIIDGWKLKRNWSWNNDCNLIIRKLLGFTRRGTKLIYIAGNHDEFMREFLEDFNLDNFGNIHICNEDIHETADGRKFMVVHGDMFDMVAQYAKWLCWLGDMGYELLLYMNRFINWFRRIFHMRRWSLSKAVKANVKKACNFISDFETCLTAYAREHGCVGCVCGHIHTADLKRLEDGFIYANTGDWVESCTAIYEDRHGKLHQYRHHE